MVKLPPGVLPYLLIGHVAIPLVINVAVNVGLGLLTFAGSDEVAVWAVVGGAVADFLGCCCFLPLITCLIATPIVRRQATAGVVSRIPGEDVPAWLRFFRGGLLLRALTWGAAGLVVFAGPVAAGWSLVAEPAVGLPGFLISKAVFAAALGVVVTPLIAITELSAEPQVTGQP